MNIIFKSSNAIKYHMVRIIIAIKRAWNLSKIAALRSIVVDADTKNYLNNLFNTYMYSDLSWYTFLSLILAIPFVMFAAPVVQSIRLTGEQVPITLYTINERK